MIACTGASGEPAGRLPADLSGPLPELRRRARRALPLARELATASYRDALERLRGRASRVVRIEPGADALGDAGAVAIYAHFSATGRVHEMVRRQLGEYRRLGYVIVLVTMSEVVPPEDWRTLLGCAGLVVQRRSFGRDFGAWKDTIDEVRRRCPALQEVLLVNDSMLGPLRPLDATIAAMRRQPEGLVGLTESAHGPLHLQSYCVMARGARAIADLAEFLHRLRLSTSRWLMVRRGEYQLTRFMRARGHAVGSVIGHQAVGRALLARGQVGAPGGFNPTHHGWRVLVEEFGFPFIKKDLVLRNPNRVADAAAWCSVVPADSPVEPATIAGYLAQSGGETGRA